MVLTVGMKELSIFGVTHRHHLPGTLRGIRVSFARPLIQMPAARNTSHLLPAVPARPRPTQGRIYFGGNFTFFSFNSENRMAWQRLTGQLRKNASHGNEDDPLCAGFYTPAK